MIGTVLTDSHEHPEAGSNEVEIVEMLLGDRHLGVNVAKVRELLQFEPELLTALPEHQQSLAGMYRYRDTTLPLVDLAGELRIAPREENDRRVVVVTEFNGRMTAFLLDGVSRIHRFSWEDFKALGEVLGRHTSKMTGTIHVDDYEILVLDLEQIVADLFPSTRLEAFAPEATEADASRERVRIFMAEDSAVIRHALLRTLSDLGYREITTFKNGQEAFVALWEVKQKVQAGGDVRDFIDVLLTDIEMPALDGLTLCRRVKADPVLGTTPVVIFSSLIDEQMALQCREVGADAYVTKPQMTALVEILDRLLSERDRHADSQTGIGR